MSVRRYTVFTIALLGVVALGISCSPKQRHEVVQIRQSDCATCHISEIDHAIDPPHDGFPNTCGDCHNSDAWSPAMFVHQWPLTGAHAPLDCTSCHTGEPPVYAGTPTECVGCHQDDYDNSPFPGHSAFSTMCQNCHTTDAWKPAVGGVHPEGAFPITNGPHQEYRNDCISCHNPNLGSPVEGENADCVGCHDGEHTRGEMDPKHREVNNYPQGMAAPNFCLDCHPSGDD